MIFKSLIHALELKSVKCNQIVTDHGSFDDIGFPDKACNKTVFRFIVDIYRRTDLLDFAIIHDNDRVRHGQCFFLVMCDIDKGNSNFLLDFL